MPESKPSAMQQIIRDAGGIVHSDGNIFFTNEAKFLAAAARAMQEQQAGVPAEERNDAIMSLAYQLTNQLRSEYGIKNGNPLYRALRRMAEVAASPSAPPVAGDSVQQPAGEAPRPYGWAVHGQLYGDEAAAKDIARNVFGDESMATAVFTAAPIQQAAQPEAMPSREFLQDLRNAMVACAINDQCGERTWRDLFRRTEAMLAAPSKPEAQQAAKPVAADESARAPDEDWHGLGMGWAFVESTDPEASDEWTTDDVARAFEAGARLAIRMASGERPTAPAPAGAEAQQDAPATRDWISPADPGAYQCRCAHCRETFIGYKRAVSCKACAALSGVAAPAGVSLIVAAAHRLCDRLDKEISVADEVAQLRAALSGAPAVAVAEPLTDEQIEPLFRRVRAMPTGPNATKDDWFWFAWGIQMGEQAHGIGSPSAKEDGQHG